MTNFQHSRTTPLHNTKWVYLFLFPKLFLLKEIFSKVTTFHFSYQISITEYCKQIHIFHCVLFLLISKKEQEKYTK